MSEKWLDEILADVGLWYLTQTDQDRYVKLIADYAVAFYVKEFLERHGYTVEINTNGMHNVLTVHRV